MKRFISLFLILFTMLLAGFEMNAQDAPSIQARFLVFSGTTSSTINTGWFNGNGDGRILVISKDNNWTNPADNNFYQIFDVENSPDGSFNNKVRIQDGQEDTDTDDYVIAFTEGTTRTMQITDLDQNTTYYFRVYEYNRNTANTVISYKTTTGTMNPRSKTTLTETTYGPLNPTVCADDGTANEDGQWVKLSWATSMGDAAEWDLSIYDNSDNSIFSDYEEIDLGQLDDEANPETFYAFIGEAGTYYAKVRARLNNQLYNWVSSETFTITEPNNYPAFDYTEQTPFTFTTGKGYVDVVFNREVTSNSTGAAADLTAADFAIIDFTQGEGTATDAFIWKIEEIGEDAQDKMAYRLYIGFDGRANGNETFVIAPADNYSIFGRNGVPMNANRGGTQVSNVIDAVEATVILSDDNSVNEGDEAYVLIADANENASNQEYIILMDGKTYTENVTITKNALTLMKDEDETEAVIAGTVTFDPIEGDATYSLTITEIELDSRGTPTSAVTVENGALFFYQNTVKYDDGDKALYFKGVHNRAYIGIEFDSDNNKMNTFTRYASLDREEGVEAYAIYSDENSVFHYVNENTLNIANNTFECDNEASLEADKYIYLNSNQNRNGDPMPNYTGALVIADNTFETSMGDAVYFTKSSVEGYDFQTFNPINIFTNTFNNSGKAIAFDDTDFTSVMPVIDILDDEDVDEVYTNTFYDSNYAISDGYVFSGYTLDESGYLYPSKAVLATAVADPPMSEQEVLEAGEGVMYYTPALAIAAAEGTCDETVFLGAGTYSDAITLNTSANLIGKGAFPEGGTLLTDKLTIDLPNTCDVIVGEMAFNITESVAETTAVDIVNVPTGFSLEVNNISIDYKAGQIGIDVTDNVIDGDLNIPGENGSNFFAKGYGEAESASATAIRFNDNQITSNVSIKYNTFQFNGTDESKDIGILFSTTNTTGASSGTITIEANQFQGADTDEPASYNGKGTAVLFQDIQDLGETDNDLSLATINIYNGNVFFNDGFGIMIEDLEDEGNNIGFIGNTLPETIDLFGDSRNTQEGFGQPGDEDYTPAFAISYYNLYGGAWYYVPGAPGFDVMYPSIQNAVSSLLPGYLVIGEGNYNESVTIPSTSDITTVLGYNTRGAGCYLTSENVLTIEKPLVGHNANDYGFNAPTVVLNHNSALLSNAHGFVQEDGLIRIPNIITIIGGVSNTVISKDGVTITRGSEDNASGGEFIGTIELTGDDQEVSYLNITSGYQSSCIQITPANTKTGEGIEISHNFLTNSSEYGRCIDFTWTKDFGTADNGITINNNTFYLTDEAHVSWGAIGAAGRFVGDLDITYNYFYMSGVADVVNAYGQDANPIYYSDRAITVNVGIGDQDNPREAGTGDLIISDNTFVPYLGNTNVNNVPIFFTGSGDESAFNSYNVYRNAFNNYGYSIIKFEIDCDLLSSVAVLDEFLNPNTFGANLVNGDRKGILGFYYSPYPIDNTTAVLTPDCSNPAAFTVGTVLAYNGETANSGTPAAYWNSHDTQLKVTVPIDKEDASLLYGAIQIYASKDNWTSSLDLGEAHSINATDTTAGEYTFAFDAETFEALTGFADANEWKFKARITDMADNFTIGTASANTIKVDQSVPVALMTGPAHNAIMNGFTQFQGTYTETGSSLLNRIEYALVRSDDNTNGNFVNYYTKNEEWEWAWESDTKVWNDVENIDAPNNGQWNENIFIDVADYENYYQWWVRAIDNAGNVSVTTEPIGSDNYRGFRVDQTPPTVVALSEVAVDNYTQLIVEYSEEMQLNASQNVNNYDLRYNGYRVPLTSAIRGNDVNSNIVTLTFASITATGITTLQDIASCSELSLTVTNVRDIALNLIANNGTTNVATYIKPDREAPYIVSINRLKVSDDGKNTPDLANDYLTSATEVTFRVTFNEPVKWYLGQLDSKNGRENQPNSTSMIDEFRIININDGVLDEYDQIDNPTGTRIISAIADEDEEATIGTTWDFTVAVGPYADGAEITISPRSYDFSFIFDGPVCPQDGTPNELDQTLNPAYTAEIEYYGFDAQSYIIDRYAPVVTNIAEEDELFTNPIGNEYWKAGEETLTWDASNIADGHTAQGDIEVFLGIGYRTNDEVRYAPVTGHGEPKEDTDQWVFTANDGSYTWNVPDTMNTDENTAIFGLYVKDEAGNIGLVNDDNDHFGFSNDFTIDNTKPEVTEITITPNNTPLNSYAVNAATETVTIVVKFDSKMNNTVPPNLGLSPILDGILNNEAPNSAQWSTTTNTNDTYTWVLAVTDNNASDLTQSITITGAEDLAGNTNKSDETSHILSNIKVDQVDPVLAWRDAYQYGTGTAKPAISATVPDDKSDRFVKNGDRVVYEYTSSEALGDVVDLAFKSPNIGAQGMIDPFMDGETRVYGIYGSIGVGNYPTDGNMTHKITMIDMAGNQSNTLDGISLNADAEEAVVVDNTFPTFTITAPEADSYTNGTQVVTIADLVETNQGTTEARIGGTAAWATFESGDAISSLSGYSSSNNGSITIYVRHTDKAGNVTTHDVTVTQDVTIPIAAVTTSVETIYEQALTQTVTVTYIEPMIGTPSITLSGELWGAATNGAWNIADEPTEGTLANTIYTVEFTLEGIQSRIDDAKATLAVEGVTDRAGNPIAEEVNSTPTFVLDNEKPTVEFALATGQTNPASGNEAKFKLTFSEEIDPATMSIFDFQYFTNGTLSATGLSYTKLSDTEYQVNVTGLTGSGDVWIQLLDEKLTDLAGNLNDASALSLHITYDNTVPTLSSKVPVNNAVAVAQNANLVMTFSEPMQKGTGNIIIYNANTSTFQTIDVASNNVTINSNIVTITHDNFLCDGQYYVQLASGVLKDLVGNSYAGIANNTTWAFSAITGGTVQAGNNGAVCSGNSINLTATATPSGANSVTGYAWTGPNDFTSNEQNPTINNAAAINAGEYFVTVTFNTTCTATSSTTVVVNPTPEAPTSDPQTFCSAEGKTIGDLVVTSLPGNTLTWYDAAEGGSTLQTTDVLTSGNYYVTQTTASSCESARGLVAVTINPTPDAPAGQAAQEFCSAVEPTVDDIAIDGLNVKWYDAAEGGNLVNGATALVDGTTYYATQTSAQNCESGRYAVTVTVHTTPNAPTAAASQTFCSEENAKVEDLAVTGTAVVWYDAATEGNVVNSTTALVNGTHYWATQTTNGCESARTEVAVTITNALDPSVAVTSAPAHTDNTLVICAGTEVVFTATPANTSTATIAYQWKVNGNNVGENQNTYTTTTLANTDAVTCELSLTGTACLTTMSATSNTVNVTVMPLPTPTFTNNPAAQVNIGNAITYTTESNNLNYVWNVSGVENTDYTKTLGGANNNSIIVTWLTSGQKTVSVNYTNNNSCTAAQATVHNVEVLDNQTAVSIATHPQDAIVCLGSAASFTGSANGYPAPTADKWEYSSDNGVQYQELTIAGVYSTTNNGFTLEISNTTGLNGYKYRLVATNTLTQSGEQFATSNAATLTTTAPETPTVSISAPNTANNQLTISAGSSVTFTAQEGNLGGGNVSYQWKVNGNNVGLDQYQYTTNALTNGQTVTCDITVTDGCVSPNNATSNTITVTVLTAPANPASITYIDRSISSLTYKVYKPIGADAVLLVLYRTTNPGVQNTRQYDANSSYPSGELLGAGDARAVLDYSTLNSQVLDSATIEISGLLRNTTYRAVAYAYNWNGTDTATIIYGGASAIRSNATSRKEGVEIEEPLMTSTFEVCRVNPNPVSGEINFCIDSREDAAFEVELYNASGELVLGQSYDLKAGSIPMKLNLVSEKGGVAAGVYYLTVTSNGETLTQQVVVLP